MAKRKNKARGIYKRGGVYWIRYAGIDGRIIRESSRSNKFKVADDLLLQRRSEIKEGNQPEIKRIANHIFSELAGQYLKWCERQRSFKSKEGFVKQLTQAFENLPLRRFNSMLVEQYQTERLQRGNKPATANRHIATLKHMFTKATEWEMVEDGVLKRIRKAKLLEENNRRLRYLSREECQNLLNHCDQHLRPIVLTALNTGMRKGEILSLRWDQVDLKYGILLLDKTKNGEPRQIHVTQTLRAELESLYKGTKERPRRVDVPWVFYHEDNDKKDKDPKMKPYKDVKRSFNTACRKAKIRDFRFHDLRHTFASQLIMGGVDLTTLKELLGHKTLGMTLRYSHLSKAHTAKAICVLDDIFGKADERRDESSDEKSSAQKVHNLRANGGMR
jgi:integrase